MGSSFPLAIRRQPGCAAALAAASSVLALAMAAGAPQARAAAIERTVPSTVRILFEDGLYGEVGLSYADPEQRGSGANTAVLGPPAVVFSGNTGDVFKSHVGFSAALKGDLTDQLSWAIIFDQPYGADTRYGAGTMTSAIPGVVFSYDGTKADLDTNQITTLAAYDLRPDVKIYGGLRAEQLKADAAVPFVGPTSGLPGYTVNAGANWAMGYLLGAAYSRPEIALRVALTYYSSIKHDLDTKEWGGIAIPGIQTTGKTQTDVETPQSVALEFQTGVAPKTLVFGSVRWVDWSEFAIEPPSYTAATGRPLVDYRKDWWTYNLGVARELTDALAASVSFTYEPSVDRQMTTLGPYDGRTAATVALSYDLDRIKITGGLTYGKLGDTTNLLETDFDDGSFWAAGLRVGYAF